MSFTLVNHRHGKTGVKVLKVNRSSPRHSVTEFFVNVLLYSPEVEVAYTRGDNSHVIATDTCKNTVYYVAKTCPMESPEQFATAIVKHFMDTYDFLTGADAEVTEKLWARATVGGVGHNHGFLRTGPEERIARAQARRGAPLKVESEIANLIVMKTTKSGFEGFHTSQQRMLPDTNERVLATNVNCVYEYTDPSRAYDYAGVRKQVLKAFTEVFFGPPVEGEYSPSVQDSLYKMAVRALESVPQISSVELDMPNIHFLPAKFLSSIGSKFEDDVFVPTVYPHGAIKAKVVRGPGGVARRGVAGDAAASAEACGGAGGAGGAGAAAKPAEAPVVCAAERSRL